LAEQVIHASLNCRIVQWLGGGLRVNAAQAGGANYQGETNPD